MPELLRTTAPGPRFYCDNNVHRLGRSLRMLGYDTLLYGAGSDDELRARRRQTGRLLLSRDSDFLGEVDSFVVTSDDHLEQLRSVVKHYQLDVESYRYSLCLECNEPIQAVPAADHAHSIPSRLLENGEPLWQCPGCRKLYWAGSHLDRMNARFDALVQLLEQNRES